MEITAGEKNGKSSSRLPKNVVPTHYTLKFQPNLKTFVFIGEESVNLEVKETTSEMLLNAADLEITTISWKGSNDTSHEIDWSFDNYNEILTITFLPPIKPSSGTLGISFTGTLNDKLKGFYRSKYVTSTGEERFNAVTQFEATDARRAFPCWDEPAIRATFDITLVAPKNKVALSNMPVKKTTTLHSDESLIEYEYERTPIMSTYLVAFIVGDFDYVEDTTTDGTLCRVYTPLGKKEQGRFALHVTTKVLPYYKEYFGIGYTLPKMDLIAIADFAIGAMENWGLVTYRETRLLVDEVETSAVNRQYVALVVGHELAHQWFGNLVALEWWTHLWLKEGYASFVEFLCVHHLFPEYDIWTQFVTEILTGALELDALDSSHPIEIPVSHPSEIDEIFDTISYNKGSAIIRMLHDFVGMDTFKRGMNMYLTRHQYGNASTDDLWNALSDASNKPIGKIMSTWTKQMGFPLVSVSQRQSGVHRILTITQRKFCSSPESSEKVGDSYLWMIPLTFSTSKIPEESAKEVLMEKSNIEVLIEGVEESEWVKVNPGTVGYYRVSYAADMLEMLVPAIRSKALPPLDRLGIIDDLFALAQCGERPIMDVMKLLEAYVHEDNLTVWTSINKIFSRLLLLLDGTECHHSLKEYGKTIFGDLAKKVGWDAKRNETHLDAMLRSLVLNRMVSLGDQDTIKEAKRRFEHHVKGEAVVVSDLRNAVYRAVLSDGDQSTFQRILTLYRQSETSEEKDRIGRSLGSLKDTDVLRQAVEFATSEEVRSQDTVIFMISIGLSHIGRNVVWEFFKEKFEFFRDRYTTNRFVSHLVKYVLENYSDSKDATDVEKFFDEHGCPGTERAVRQACESIRLNEQWMAKNYDNLVAFLKSAL